MPPASSSCCYVYNTSGWLCLLTESAGRAPRSCELEIASWKLGVGSWELEQGSDWELGVDSGPLEFAGMPPARLLLRCDFDAR